MTPRIRFFIIAIIIPVLFACGESTSLNGAESHCTDQWYQAVEKQLDTSDGQGHGPDVGSFEWRGVVEYKLGIRDNADTPDTAGNEWCEYINELVFGRAN